MIYPLIIDTSWFVISGCESTPDLLDLVTCTFGFCGKQKKLSYFSMLYWIWGMGAVSCSPEMNVIVS